MTIILLTKDGRIFLLGIQQIGVLSKRHVFLRLHKVMTWDSKCSFVRDHVKSMYEEGLKPGEFYHAA